MIGFDQGSTAASFNHSVVIAITMAMVIACARWHGAVEVDSFFAHQIAFT